ncbi:transposable element Tcb2 transposase [Trichonephila clavipes]|nr:transposable element Tcb2 transposase [Trichonephila clavipes]
MDPTCQQGTVEADGGSEMVWGVCSWRDMGSLIRLDTTLVGDRYIMVLSDHLHPFMSIVHSDGLGEFRQDNATPLTSSIATEWLQKHFFEFRYFHWSPKSPDRNIVNLCEMSCNALFRRSLHPLFLQLIYGQPFRIPGVSITSSTTSDTNRIHATSCCGTFACSLGPYTILGRGTSFF